VKFPSATEAVSFAAGFEYRKESLDFQPDLAYQEGWGAGQGSTILPVSGSYNVKDLFVEAALPLIQDVVGAQNVSVSLGYRYSDYNITGSHPSWKVEGAYAPSSAFKVRAGFNRATRSPNVVELFQSQHLVLGGSTDPCSGASPSFTQAQCALQGVSAAQYGTIQPNPAAQYNTTSGGNPNLVPEVADTTSVGVVVAPKSIAGFSVALDYYNINLKDTIGSLNADDVLRQCGLTGDPVLCGLIHRDQFGSLWRTPDGYTVSTNENVGSKRAQGLDVNTTYVLEAAGGAFNFNFIGTYLMKAYINTGLFAYDCVGLTGPVCNDPYSDHPAMQPKWRHLFRAAWQRGPMTLSLGWRLIGPVTAEQLSNQTALQDLSLAEQLKLNYADKYGTWNYIDVAVSRNVMQHVTWTVGINNVFDKNPPLGSGSSANDYADGFYGTYDSYGRFVHAAVHFSF
jgi:iron complex outermembrane receptor protein